MVYGPSFVTLYIPILVLVTIVIRYVNITAISYCHNGQTFIFYTASRYDFSIQNNISVVLYELLINDFISSFLKFLSSGLYNVIQKNVGNALEIKKLLKIIVIFTSIIITVVEHLFVLQLSQLFFKCRLLCVNFYHRFNKLLFLQRLRT